MYKLETNPLTVSGVLKNGWQLYKSSIKYVLVWSFVLAILHVIPYLFGYVGFYNQNTAGRLIFSWWGLLFTFILLIVEAFFVAVIFYTMYLLATEQKSKQSVTINYSTTVLLNLYLAMVVYYLALNVGILLFILPAIFIAILFSMFLPFIVIERQNVYSSLESSAKLVWGHWWQTFFVLVLPYAIIYLARNILKFSPWTGDWTYIVDIVLLTITAPYYYGVILIQYANLKVIRSLPEPISTRPRADLSK